MTTKKTASKETFPLLAVAITGVAVAAVTSRNWEQDKREPAGAAKALLKIFATNPELALAALEGLTKHGP